MPFVKHDWFSNNLIFSVGGLVPKGAILYLRQFLATESPLKMMKHAFNFALKALLVFKTFKVLS